MLPSAQNPGSAWTGQLALCKGDNEGDAHYGLKLAAWEWLRARGMKIRGAEVLLPFGRVDVIGMDRKQVGGRRGDELRAEAHRRARDAHDRWLAEGGQEQSPWKQEKHYRSELELAELVVGAGDEHYEMVVVEAKASRRDFLADLRSKQRKLALAPQLASRCYFICPTGLVTVDEVPTDWGLITIDAGSTEPRVQLKAKRGTACNPALAWHALLSLCRPHNIAADQGLDASTV